MLYRKNFILDVHNGKINVSNYKWTELEEKYGFPTPEGYKLGDRARTYFKWYDTVGKNKGEWMPGESINDEDVTLGENEPIIHDRSEPINDITGTRIYQEFLAWKTSQENKRTFTPGTFVILGCTHVPFHNKPFFNAVINLCSDINPTGLILNGDFMDMNSISSHDKGQKPIAPHVTLSWEYQQGNEALDKLDNCADWQIKYYSWGNHEDRIWREMRKTDVAKLGEALIAPTKGLQLKERGYEVQEKWKEAVIYLGKYLEVIHGESVSRHSAAKHIDVFRTSVAFNHTHRIQTYVEGDVAGFNLGWGGDITSPAFNYATKAMKASWKNGFGICTIDELGGYHMDTIFWHNNRFYYGGKKYC